MAIHKIKNLFCIKCKKVTRHGWVVLDESRTEEGFYGCGNRGCGYRYSKEAVQRLKDCLTLCRSTIQASKIHAGSMKAGPAILDQESKTIDALLTELETEEEN